jgi:hypothetical protein
LLLAERQVQRRPRVDVEPDGAKMLAGDARYGPTRSGRAERCVRGRSRRRKVTEERVPVDDADAGVSGIRREWNSTLPPH